MAYPQDPREENRILAALPAYAAAITAHAEDVPLRRGDVVIESGPKNGSVYFPRGGLISLVVAMPDGAIAEAAVVGREGLVGHPYIADFEAAPSRAIVQVEGRATRIPGEAFHAALRSEGTVRDVVAKFGRAFFAQTLQAVACNALHGVDERLAKWLLQCADRTESPVPLTHEFLAEMLGISRPTISITARIMQTEGLIGYRRGQIEIIDRAGLEELACPCYRAIRHAYEQLLPLSYS